MTEETRARFLAAIGAQIPADRVQELHLFGAIRQGGTESGIAVVAVAREADLSLDVDGGYIPPPAVADAAPVESHGALTVHDQLDDESRFVSDEVVDAEPPVEPEPAVAETPAPAPRYIVYTARYRLTLKGPDRGKWEMSVKEEADAPLLTVDAVVRGVSRRSGDADETVRLTGDEFRAALPEPARP
jgi:hypothetical protein